MLSTTKMYYRLQEWVPSMHSTTMYVAIIVGPHLQFMGWNRIGETPETAREMLRRAIMEDANVCATLVHESEMPGYCRECGSSIFRN